MEFGQKKIREIDLFDFTSFFGLDFFKFSGTLWDIILSLEKYGNFIFWKIIWSKNPPLVTTLKSL